MIYKTITALCLFFLTLSSFAHPTLQRYIVAPICLLAKLNLKYTILASNKQISLIQTNANVVHALRETSNHKRECGGFKDVTMDWRQLSGKESAIRFLNQMTTKKILSKKMKRPSEYTIKYNNQVDQLLALVNPNYIWNRLATLTHFPDRYAGENFAGSANGVKAALWIKAELETLALESQRDDIKIFTIDTQYGQEPTVTLKQPSVIIKIGNQPATHAGIVLGAHMDTLSSKYEVKPGADDDGSGSAAMLETARVILSSGMTFKKPIYLIWYAAEEMGLLGSQSVVKKFAIEHIAIDQALQFDTIGLAYQNDLTMWLLKDTNDTDDDLSTYLESLITTYLHRTVKYTSCGYACSDHASWMHNGIPAASLIESSFATMNDSMHSADDTLEKLSLEHIADYTKLAIAAAVELAEPIS